MPSRSSLDWWWTDGSVKRDRVDSPQPGRYSVGSGQAFFGFAVVDGGGELLYWVDDPPLKPGSYLASQKSLRLAVALNDAGGLPLSGAAVKVKAPFERHRPTVSFTLSEQTIRRLAAMAKQKGITRSRFVEELVEAAHSASSWSRPP